MRKIFLFLLLGLLLYSGFSYANLLDPLYENVREQAVASFRDIFSGKVIIGRAGLGLTGQVLLYDVKIGEDLEAPQVIINFNPLKYLARRGDMVPAITSIKVISGRAKIIRNRRGRLNALYFLKPAENKGGGIPFRARVYLNNCRAEYADEAGLPYNPVTLPFKTRLENLNGNINLTRFPRINLSLSGQIVNGGIMQIKGKADLAKPTYDFKLSSSNLTVADWSGYLLPNIYFKSGRASVDLGINNREITLKAGGLADDMPFEVSGRIYKDLDLNLSLPRVKFEKIRRLLTQISSVDVEGVGSVQARLAGPYQKMRAEANLEIISGKLYQQALSGRLSLKYQDGKISLARSALKALEGRLNLIGQVNLKEGVRFNLAGDLYDIKLEQLANNMPGISGRVKGSVAVTGFPQDFSGNLRLDLISAALWGQPVKEAQADFNYRDQTLTLSQFRISSEQAAFLSSGVISKDGLCELTAEAQGLSLKGEGILGPMEANLKSFAGELVFYLDEEFFERPLKNLSAQGRAILSHSRLGEQEIDQAQGGIKLENGIISFEGVSVTRGSSAIYLAGSVGIGAPTNLKVYSDNLHLSDLQILNQVLPKSLRKVSGQASLDLDVYGQINDLVSIDSLLSLQAAGRLKIWEAQVGEVRVRQASVEADWENQEFSLRNGYFQTDRSQFQFGLDLKKEGFVNLMARGRVNLLDLGPLSELGGLAGEGKIDLSVTGERSKPQVLADFDFRDLRFNKISLQTLNGRIRTRDNKVVIEDPIEFQTADNEFKLVGYLLPAEEILNLKLELEKGKLNTFLDFYQNLMQEANRFAQPLAAAGKVKVDLKRFSLPQFVGSVFYRANGANSYFLTKWNQVFSEVVKYRNSLNPPALEKMSGELKGEIQLYGPFSSPMAYLKGEIQQGAYGKYDFDKFEIDAYGSTEAVKIRQAVFKKKDGNLKIYGDLNLKNEKLALRVLAERYPVDILRLIADRPYSGSFKLDAQLRGNFKNPEMSASLATEKVILDGVAFDKISGTLFYNQNLVNLKQLKLINGGQVSEVNGFYDFGGEANISASLEGSALGLLNLFTDEIKWREGKAQGQLIFAVHQGQPQIQGFLNVWDGLIYLKRLDSNLDKVYLELTAEENRLELKRFLAYWLGKSTRGKINYLSLAGWADLKEGKLNISLADSSFFVDLPGAYSGNLGISGASLYGPFASPTLTAKVVLREGTLYLPEVVPAGEGEGKSGPSLKFDLALDLDRNVYLAGGNVMTLDLSNILINLEMVGSGLRLSGDLAQPVLVGRVDLKRGTVSIFNREFTLLSADMQKTYFGYNLGKVSDNYAQFSGVEGLMPYLNLTASVKVEDYTLDSGGNQAKKEVTVLSFISGVPGSKEKEKGVNIGFEAFEKDPAGGGLMRSKYSDSEIKVLLLPDFIKSATGIERDSQVDANAVVADYLHSRLQTFIFRGVERQLEQALGLESLTLEYNFGQDLRRALGAQDVARVEKPAWGVGFVKGFFDRFYIDVRYRQTMEQQTGAEIPNTFNYQITYKLTPIWSFSYYREPLSLYDLNTGYSKTTLKAGHSF